MAMVMNMPEEALSEVAETLQRILDFHTQSKRIEEMGPRPTNRKECIAYYEKMHGISSDEFLKRWKEDTIEDTFETNHWAMLLDRQNTI